MIRSSTGKRRSLTTVLLVALVFQPVHTNAGAYIFANEGNGVDLVIHPTGYTGAGGIVSVNVCIVPGTPNASSMEIPVENAVNTWNKLVPGRPNSFLGADNDIAFNEIDFESVAVHEIGHCLGNGHPNAAAESGLQGVDRDYTKATNGADDTLNIDAGVDGVRGSADDVRGDDVNLHWFHQATNSPLALPPVTDSSTYARDTVNLPVGDSFAANGNRDALAALGAENSEAVMQQGIFIDEARRELVGDDITTRQLAMSGLDLLEGTADDYSYELSYQGISAATSCDINISFDDTKTGFANCLVGASFVSPNNWAISSANSHFNTGVNWNFNAVPNSPVARADLNPASISIGDRHGSSVDIDGNYAVIGVRLDDHSTYSNAGSAFIYRRQPGDSWVLETQLFGALDSSSDQDKFGHSVAISGDTVAIGAEGDDDNGFRAGRVYLFGRDVGGTDNWGLITSVVGSDTVAKDFFGRSVALDADTLVVGAHNADALGVNSGAVYIFKRDQGGTDNWGQVQQVLASDGASGDRFGIDVAVDSDNLVVGAHRKTVGPNANTGKAYFFRKTGAWAEIGSYPGEAAGDQFGLSVDLDGDRAVVGAWLSDSLSGNQTGAAFVFDYASVTNLWSLDQKISRPSQAAGDRFGASVAISGERILVGAPNEDSAGSDAGSAYSFEHGGTWVDAGEVINPQVSTRDAYGSRVALDSVFGLVGAPLDNQPGNNSGGAYIETL